MGTDPTDDANDFTVSIEAKKGRVEVTWVPDLNEGGKKHERVYTIWGTSTLRPAAWHSPTNALDRFFKVTVEMP